MTIVQPARSAGDSVDLPAASSRPTGRRGQRFQLPQTPGPAVADRAGRRADSRLREAADTEADGAQGAGAGGAVPVLGALAAMTPIPAAAGQADGASAAGTAALLVPDASGAQPDAAGVQPGAAGTPLGAAMQTTPDLAAGAAGAVPRGPVARAAGRAGQPGASGGLIEPSGWAAGRMPTAEDGLAAGLDPASAMAGWESGSGAARPTAPEPQPGRVPHGLRQAAAGAAATDRPSPPMEAASGPSAPAARRPAGAAQTGGQQGPAFGLEAVMVRDGPGDHGRPGDVAGSREPQGADLPAPADVMVGHAAGPDGAGGALDVRIAAATAELRDRLRAATDELHAELAQIGTEVDAIRVELRGDMMADGGHRDGWGGSGFEGGSLEKGPGRGGELDAAAGPDAHGLFGGGPADLGDGAFSGRDPSEGAGEDDAFARDEEDGIGGGEDAGGETGAHGAGHGGDPARREAALVRLMLAPSAVPAPGTELTKRPGGQPAGPAHRIDRYA